MGILKRTIMNTLPSSTPKCELRFCDPPENLGLAMRVAWSLMLIFSASEPLSHRSKTMKTFVLQPFLIGAAGAFGMSVGMC